MESYERLPGFEHVVLEESWVLAISTDPELSFDVEVVLTRDHPDWSPPRPGEVETYRRMKLVFPGAESVTFEPSGAPPAQDASGEFDLGQIDSFTLDDGTYRLEGSWGEAAVVGGEPKLLPLSAE